MNIARGQIYKITYPNGKIYIGQDRTNDINYFGSAHSPTIAADFPNWQTEPFSVTKEILFDGTKLTIQELNSKEVEYIKRFRSHEDDVGYNRTPRGKRK